MNESETIRTLQRRIIEFPPVDCVTNRTVPPKPPMPLTRINEFESVTGLRLTPFVRRVYSEVANGGFGPAYGLLPLLADQEDSVLDWHQRYQATNKAEPDGPQWPAHLLHLCEAGCAAIFALDTRTAEAPVFKVEGNESDHVADWLQLVSPSVEVWLYDWANQTTPDPE